MHLYMHVKRAHSHHIRSQLCQLAPPLQQSAGHMPRGMPAPMDSLAAHGQDPGVSPRHAPILWIHGMNGHRRVQRCKVQSAQAVQLSYDLHDRSRLPLPIAVVLVLAVGAVEADGHHVLLAYGHTLVLLQVQLTLHVAAQLRACMVVMAQPQASALQVCLLRQSMLAASSATVPLLYSQAGEPVS